MKTDREQTAAEALEWQRTFDAMTDFVAVLDREFRFVQVNRAMAEFLKKSSGELRGTRCHEVMHGRSAHWPSCPHAEMLASGLPVTREVGDPHIGVPLLVTASPIFDDNGTLIGSVHIAKDISDLKRAKETLDLRNRQLENLNQLSRRAMEGRSLEDVVDIALDGIRQAVGPDLALFYLEKEGWLILQGARSVEAGDDHLNEKKRVGQCLCGLAAAKGKAVYSRDIHRDGRCTLNECKEAGMRSFAALPLLQEGRSLGVLGIASRQERGFEDEREFLEILAGTLSVVTRNALLIEELRRHTLSLEDEVQRRVSEIEKRNADLERLNRLFVDREFRIKELRDRVKTLEAGRA